MSEGKNKEPFIWSGMEMPTNDHKWNCQCKECVVIHWLEEVEEVKALRETLQQRKSRWVDLTDEEIDRLWDLCRIPAHLDAPNSVQQRFGRALSFALREKNYDAFCADGRGNTPKEKNT